MTPSKRAAPDAEWVLMYRRGITTPKIAAGAAVSESTVRYHLAIAAKLDPSIRSEHRAALPVAQQRLTLAGQRNLENIVALYLAEGRLPTKRSAHEKALSAWLRRRRQEAAQGTLSPIYAVALDVIPGWGRSSTKQVDDEKRWKQRLVEVSAYRAAGNDWPRHNKTKDQSERVLGVWLHGQRINDRTGKLDAGKKSQLDKLIPGWRKGRRGRNASS
ncbi:helicase associated domain-containing protein [Pseudarthrobacter sp. MEB009]|uniref:helicase associated domain-containing protein n=1 Tax=Pseudarthrobacter sp. MEB009 TaxID=3040326 RepID=UPI0025571852|nr:helicase associated domain-containing protein [Pseudarthrobacter sp. MEB009]